MERKRRQRSIEYQSTAWEGTARAGNGKKDAEDDDVGVDFMSRLATIWTEPSVPPSQHPEVQRVWKRLTMSSNQGSE